MELKTYNRKIIWNTILILLVVAVFTAVSYWLKKDMDEYAQQVYLSREVTAKNTHSLELLAKLKQGSSEIGEYQKQIDQLLPTQDQLINLNRWLDGIARASQVQASFNFEGSGNLSEGGLPAYSYFTIVADGDYSALVLFMREIEVKSTAYLITLETVDVSRRDSQYRLVTRGRVYYK